MSKSNAIIGGLIPIMSGLIQLKYHAQSLSPFETQPVIMTSFSVVLCAYVSALMASIGVPPPADQNSNGEIDEIMSNICTLLGSLASILLLLILNRVLGWVVAGFWALYLVYIAYVWVNNYLLPRLPQKWGFNRNQPGDGKEEKNVEIQLKNEDPI